MSTEHQHAVHAVPSPEPIAEKTKTRPEIQALRAIAVLGVVTFHLWSKYVPGGYVGVDVFFVISGFLISSHLLREVARTGRIRLASFWARRARRLLPASLLVIVVSFIGMMLWAPPNLWDQFDQEFAASALYVQNWVLAFNSVDYLAANNTASPVQHYWSLSVEEQFYIVWPLLILAAVGLTALLRKPQLRRRAIIVVLGVVTAVSLVFCVFYSHYNPAPSYFITPVRAWEFGMGGLLALFIEKQGDGRPRVRALVSILGLVGVIGTMFWYTSAINFPGYHALLPTVATAAVIWAGSPNSRLSPVRLLGLRPVQFLGNVSYSFYLWHWPPIVLLPYALGGNLTWKERIGIFVGSLLLAWLTRILVEEPVRRGRFLTKRTPYLSLGFTALAMVIVLGATTTASGIQDQYLSVAIAKSRALTKPGTPCLGAAALDPKLQPCVNPLLKGQLLPDRSAGERDWVVPPGKNCRTSVSSTAVLRCEFATGKNKKVALIGDSHAEHWLPAMTIIAKQEGWTLDTFLKGGCPFSATERLDNESTAKGSCVTWNKEVMKKLEANHYDLVVTSEVTDTTFVHKSGQTSMQAGVAGLVTRWDQLQKLGTSVVAIRDDPQLPRNVPVCLSLLHGDITKQLYKCEGKESTALFPDPQVEAAKESGAGLVTLTQFFCTDGVCPAVIGSVVVYRDNAHLGGTYSRSLSPYIEKQLLAYLATQANGARTPAPS